ncbi:hypothetical protein [Aliivibrio sifiae]|uniref:Uncharacterized protein n=1 Tax=Aliivibrio sifiae TaxID=566293 RepID=A0A2S7X2X4_9GAMM|nr:hypothetical protein [Aliivibrio sifiae]PQJ84543.1 hypothetical protein BTO22_13575 [Aliivibrio sifiae]
MEIAENIFTILGAMGFTSVGTAFMLKTFIQTGIKESISNIYKKELEVHKFYLKNSEMVFKYKLEASKKLYKIRQSIIPKITNSDMDWDDAKEEIASSFEVYEKALDEFLCEYQATLSADVLKRICDAVSACSKGQFGYYWKPYDSSPTCTQSAKDNASELLEAIDEAAELLRKEVHSLISVPSA